ncbi:MarR family winged helix-turn-helix transcriptional regulator [Actinocatenispora rupis]|uniref:HTH marR-type domain-containing protein n=1 Tax=Actinocatenispora rupis TaxID=519421 RepID=A0A8J3J5G8_9ACTN|nr:MarR family transcriptional regulator [Actinocatenispora rupis]GID09718.1 hypothetical protein Aru02nite_06070 [Actinocatenispora rupis]
MGDVPYEELPERLQRMPSRLLAQTAAQGQRIVGEALSAHDARTHHYAVLAALAEFGPASQSAIADRTGIYRSDLVATLNELADRDLTRRAPDPDDRRRNVITLTPAGRRHLRRLDTTLGRAQDRLLAPLDDRERATLTALLTRVLTHHTATG